jgi:hypothetical protein
MTTNFPAPGSTDAQQLTTVFEYFSVLSNSSELSDMDTTDIEIGTPFYITNFNVSYNVADWYAKESNILTRVTTTPVGYQILRFNNVSNYVLNFKTGNRIKITNLTSNASSVVTISAATVSSITIPVITEFPIHGNISIRVVNLSTEVYTRTSVTQRNIQSGEVFVNVTAPRNNLFLSEVTPTVRGVRFPDGQRLNSIQSAVAPANLETYVDLGITGEKSLVITNQSPNAEPTKVLYFASQFFIPFRNGSTVRVKSASGYISTFTVLDCTTTSVTLDKGGLFETENTTVDNLANTVRKVTNTNPIESSLSLRNLLYSMTKSNNVFISRSTSEVPQSSTIQTPIAKVAEVTRLKSEQTPKLELFFNVPRFTENVIVSTSSTDTTIPITFNIQLFSNNVVNWYATDGDILQLTAIPLTTLTLYFNNTIGITTGSTISVIEYTSKFFKSVTVLSANSYSATVAYDLSIIKDNLYVYVNTTLTFTQKSFIPYAIEGAVLLSLPNNISFTTNITKRTASLITFVKTYFVDTTVATISDSNPSYYPQGLVVTNQLPLTPRENLYYAVALPYYRTEQTVKIAEEPKTFSIVGKVSKFKSDQYQGFVVPKTEKVQSVKFSASADSVDSINKISGVVKQFKVNVSSVTAKTDAGKIKEIFKISADSVTVGNFSSLPKFSTVPTAISASALGQTVYNTLSWYSFELNILQRQTVINATTTLVFNNESSYAYLFAAGDTVKLYRSNYTTFVQVLSVTLTTITFATPVDFPTDTLGLTIQNYSSTIYPTDITFTEMAPLGMPRDVALPRQNLISAEYIKPNQRGSTDFNIERDAVVGRNLTTTSGLISQLKVDVVSITSIIKSDSLNKPLMTVVSVTAKTDAGKIKEIFKISADSNILYENQGKVITPTRLTAVDSINKISGVVKQFKVDQIAGVTSEPAKIIVSPITPIQFWN